MDFCVIQNYFNEIIGEKRQCNSKGNNCEKNPKNCLNHDLSKVQVAYNFISRHDFLLFVGLKPQLRRGKGL